MQEKAGMQEKADMQKKADQYEHSIRQEHEKGVIDPLAILKDILPQAAKNDDKALTLQQKNTLTEALETLNQLKKPLDKESDLAILLGVFISFYPYLRRKLQKLGLPQFAINQHPAKQKVEELLTSLKNTTLEEKATSSAFSMVERLIYLSPFLTKESDHIALLNLILSPENCYYAQLYVAPLGGISLLPLTSTIKKLPKGTFILLLNNYFSNAVIVTIEDLTLVSKNNPTFKRLIEDKLNLYQRQLQFPTNLTAIQPILEVAHAFQLPIKETTINGILDSFRFRFNETIVQLLFSVLSNQPPELKSNAIDIIYNTITKLLNAQENFEANLQLTMSLLAHLTSITQLDKEKLLVFLNSHTLTIENSKPIIKLRNFISAYLLTFFDTDDIQEDHINLFLDLLKDFYANTTLERQFTLSTVASLVNPLHTKFRDVLLHTAFLGISQIIKKYPNAITAPLFFELVGYLDNQLAQCPIEPLQEIYNNAHSTVKQTVLDEAINSINYLSEQINLLNKFSKPNSSPNALADALNALGAAEAITNTLLTLSTILLFVNDSMLHAALIAQIKTLLNENNFDTFKGILTIDRLLLNSLHRTNAALAASVFEGENAVSTDFSQRFQPTDEEKPRIADYMKLCIALTYSNKSIQLPNSFIETIFISNFKILGNSTIHDETAIKTLIELIDLKSVPTETLKNPQFLVKLFNLLNSTKSNNRKNIIAVFKRIVPLLNLSTLINCYNTFSSLVTTFNHSKGIMAGNEVIKAFHQSLFARYKAIYEDKWELTLQKINKKRSKEKEEALELPAEISALIVNFAAEGFYKLPKEEEDDSDLSLFLGCH